MSLTVWSNHPFSDEALARFRQALGSHRLLRPAAVTENNLTAGASDPQARSADVLHGQPAVEDLVEGSARWVALTSAGYTRYDREDVRQALRGRKARLTNASGVYDEPCAQHVLAQMLAASRQLPACLEHQRDRDWQSASIRQGSLLLKGQRVLILGHGAIARRLAELLRPFQMEVTGVRRHPTGEEAISCVTPEAVDGLLGDADHVVNILPANASTEGFMNAERIGRMKRSAVYYSIGRGNTTDQTALREALEQGRLAAAYLDVVDPEPPPPEDPIWTTPGCVITPHSAGGFAGEEAALLEHFLENLRRFEADEGQRDAVV